jgi:dTMP kinase
VYQGVARRLAPDTVAFINDFAVGGCLPDVTFLLDLDLAEARRRMAARNNPEAPPDRMEQEPDAFYEAVRAGYLRLAQACPSRVRRLDASRPEREIESEILEILSGQIHGIFPPPAFGEARIS